LAASNYQINSFAHLGVPSRDANPADFQGANVEQIWIDM
jgi:hypothetical protein